MPLQRSSRQAQPSRFDLIVQMIDVSSAAAQLQFHAHLTEDEREERWESIASSTQVLGRHWAEEDPDGSLLGLPNLLYDVVQQAPREWADSISDAFYDGYLATQRQRCVFPKPRPKNERPDHVLEENDHFWLASEGGALLVVSKNVSGGFGSVKIPPAIGGQVFDTVEERDEQNLRDWYRHDPYGMEPPRPRLLRDDLRAGWRDNLTDDWAQDSETLGELSLSVDHPGRGEIYFGAPAQELQQLASFLALQDGAQAWLTQSKTPERYQEAEQRALRINTVAAVR